MSEQHSQNGSSKEEISMPRVGDVFINTNDPKDKGTVVQVFGNESALVERDKENGGGLYMVRRRGEKLFGSTEDWSEIGDEFPVWIEGHASATCMGYAEDGSPMVNLELPDGEFVAEERNFGWNVEVE